jgi:hypothetical protein
MDPVPAAQPFDSLQKAFRGCQHSGGTLNRWFHDNGTYLSTTLTDVSFEVLKAVNLATVRAFSEWTPVAIWIESLDGFE